MRREDVRASLRAYRPVILIAVAGFFCELGFSTINISTLPVYLSRELHKVQWLGLILGFQTFFDTLSRPFLGALGDRIGRRWIIILGPLLSAITSALTVYISIGVLFGFRVVDGLAAGALWTSVYAETGDVTDVKRRNTAMSIVNVAFIMALALGPLAGGLIDHELQRHFAHIGQPAFLFSSLALVLGCAVAYKVFRPKRWARPSPPGGPGSAPAGASRSGLGFKARDLTYTVRTFPRMMILAFLLYIGLGLIMPLIKLYALDRYGISGLTFGWVLAVEAAALALLSIPLSRIGTHWGAHRAVFLGMILVAGALWVLTYSRRISLVFVSAGTIGLGVVLGLPAWLAFITEIAPQDRKGEVLGVIGFGQGLGMLFGSSLAGILFANEGWRLPAVAVDSQNSAFFLASVAVTLMAALSYKWVFKRKMSERP